MKIKKVHIVNFRKIKDISFECVDTINTIVGPNGIGKSSILDAIRLIKAILLPTSDNEAQVTLQFMGLFSPSSGDLLHESICGDPRKETVIDVHFEISKEEIGFVNNNLSSFNIFRLQNQLGRNIGSRLNLVGYLSSPQGRSQLNAMNLNSKEELKKFSGAKVAHVKLSINKSDIDGYEGFNQELISFLLKSPVFSETLFTVFSADRSFPTGEINISLHKDFIEKLIQINKSENSKEWTELSTVLIPITSKA